MVTPLLARHPFARPSCACPAPCGHRAELGADLPAGPPSGRWEDVAVPPPWAPAAIRAQAAEVVRRAAWSVGMWPQAIRAWETIAALPAMPRGPWSDVGQVVPVIRDWMRRALEAVPPELVPVAVALRIYLDRVMVQLDTYSPLAMYRAYVAWRQQSADDLVDDARTRIARAARAASANVGAIAAGWGLGSAIGVAGVSLAAAAVLGAVLAPEQTGALVASLPDRARRLAAGAGAR